MKQSMHRDGAARRRRLLDELIEALRRWEAELGDAFDWRNHQFDPRDPRLLTALLAVLGAFLAVALLAALITGQS